MIHFAIVNHGSFGMSYQQGLAGNHPDGLSPRRARDDYFSSEFEQLSGLLSLGKHTLQRNRSRHDSLSHFRPQVLGENYFSYSDLFTTAMILREYRMR